MQVFGGGSTISRANLNVGDWLYCVDYKNKPYLSKVVSDHDENLMFLEFSQYGEEPVSIYYIDSSSKVMIKLNEEPVLNLYPTSIKSGYNACQTGYILCDQPENISIAITQPKGSGGNIQWVNFVSNQVSKPTRKKDTELYYTKWELLMVSHNSENELFSVRYGFDA